MKLQLRSYLGECIMLFPNINFWTDDDPEYAPYKYQFFIGWLFWGIRIFFGHEPKPGTHAVHVIHNEVTAQPIPSSDITPGFYLCRVNNIPDIPMIVLRYNGESWVQYWNGRDMHGWIQSVTFQFEPIQRVADDLKW